MKCGQFSTFEKLTRIFLKLNCKEAVFVRCRYDRKTLGIYRLQVSFVCLFQYQVKSTEWILTRFSLPELHLVHSASDLNKQILLPFLYIGANRLGIWLLFSMTRMCRYTRNDLTNQLRRGVAEKLNIIHFRFGTLGPTDFKFSLNIPYASQMFSESEGS